MSLDISKGEVCVILGIDSFELGLIKAAEIIEDGRIEGFVDVIFFDWVLLCNQ